MKKILSMSLFLIPFIAQACQLNGSIDNGAEYERDEHTVFNMNISATCSETDADFNLILLTGNSNTSNYRYFYNGEGLVNGIDNTNRLKYYVYTDIQRMNIFGDGTSGTKKVFFPTSTSTITKTFPLVVPENQPTRPGKYSDTLEFEIEY